MISAFALLLLVMQGEFLRPVTVRSQLAAARLRSAFVFAFVYLFALGVRVGVRVFSGVCIRVCLSMHHYVFYV